jgi:hypothetical protein
MVWPRGGDRIVLSNGEGRLVFFDLALLDARIRTNAGPVAPARRTESPSATPER